MRTIARSNWGHVFGVSFVMFAVFLLIDGCKDDDSNPIIPGASVFPSVAVNWIGEGGADMGAARGGVLMFDKVATIAQAADSNLSGSWLYTGRGLDTRQTRVLFVGKISKSRAITIQETSWVAVNWTPGAAYWALATNITGKLSSGGDTISGSGTAGMSTYWAGNGGMTWPYTFVLVKK